MAADMSSDNKILNYEPERDIEEIQALEKKKKKEALEKKKTRIKIIAIVALAAIIILVAAILIIGHIKYSSYEVVSSQEAVSTGEKCAVFKSNILKYSKNGIKYSTNDGTTIWEYGCSQTTPTLIISDDYGLIYDLNANGLVLFDADGIVASYTSSLPIAAAGLSNYGVAAVMVQDGTNSSVYFYDATGRKLDIEVRNVLAQNSGYPISMSLSPSGTGLALSLVFLDRGSMETRISFLNFDVGKDSTDRVVGYFEYDGVLFPQVSYLDAENVVAFGDDRIVFYSLSNEASPKLSEEIVFDEQIKSVAAGNGCAAVVTVSANGGYVLHIYSASGSEKLTEEFDFEYSFLGISGDYVMLYGGERCLIATTAGVVKYDGSFDGITTDMSSLGSNKFIQYGDYGARVIKLK